MLQRDFSCCGINQSLSLLQGKRYEIIIGSHYCLLNQHSIQVQLSVNYMPATLFIDIFAKLQAGLRETML
jgi:hypothetical protein